MRRAVLLLFALCALQGLGTAAQSSPDEAALKAALPADCGKEKAPDHPRFRKSDPLPSARTIAESYGSLSGPLAEFLKAHADVDFVFDTDLCDTRDWDDAASGVEFEVVEYLLCNEVIEVELRHEAPVDPLKGVVDAGVAKVTYATPGAPPVVVSDPDDLKEVLFLLRTRSRSNVVQNATRPMRDASGFVTRSEVSESSPGADAAPVLSVVFKDGKEKSFHGHARSGEFGGFSNTDLYPFLERLALRAGQPPPKE